MENGALFGKYEVGRLLGCGAFAKVYYARNIKKNGQSVAIKVINKKKIAGSSLMSNIKREISIMSRLRHPNIVRLYEVLATKSKIYFVMEYVKGGELFAKVAKGRFSEEVSRKFFQQLISAVGYCHSRGVYHRDLKPENLLVDENGDLKVSDFGLSAVKEQQLRSDGLLHTLCGTPAYVAPEILAKKGYDGAKVDVWSCGVILYVLTAGYLPFNDPNLMAMYKKIYKGEFRCPKWMSSDLKRFLGRLLNTNPKTRITIHEITQDPWFTIKAKGKDKDDNNNNNNKVAINFTFSDYFLEQDDDDDDEYDDVKKDVKASATAASEPSSPSSSSSSSVQHPQLLRKSVSLNAFDLISFSSGLDLSGLFDHSFNPLVDGDRFLSAEPADKILDRIGEVARAENLNLRVKKHKDLSSYGVVLQSPNSNCLVKVEIEPLTDQLMVVQVRKKAGDSASYDLIWKKKLKPNLSSLVHDPKAAAATTSTTSMTDDGGA